ncbi:hypothetical protein HOY82DRAFT_491986, partial [Tuber indicum]
KILGRALILIPHSFVLWKEAIKLESDRAETKTLSSRAVQLAPSIIELRLTLCWF